MHIIRRILEQYRQKYISIIMTFIDYKKALGTVNRETMWKILINYGVPEKRVKIIKIFYNGSTSVVHVDRILSKDFLVTTRVLQGDISAPFLFIIVLDWVLQKTEITTGLQTHQAEILLGTDLAYDILLLDQYETESIKHFQQ